jgi:hypothetical protein
MPLGRLDGTSELTVVLGGGQNAVDGTFDFSQTSAGTVLQAQGVAANGGFGGLVAGADKGGAVSGVFAGNFYGSGPDPASGRDVPQAVGGTFDVQTLTDAGATVRFVGVFDAALDQAPAAPP